MTFFTNKSVIRVIIGGLIGALLGYLYYRFVGCATGACPITRNPFSSTIYGAVLGSLLASSL